MSFVIVVFVSDVSEATSMNCNFDLKMSFEEFGSDGLDLNSSADWQETRA